MHLLAAQPGTVADGSAAVDLGQSPGDIVVLSAADTELACLAAARARLEHSLLARRCPAHPVPAVPEPTSPHRGEVTHTAARLGEPPISAGGRTGNRLLERLASANRRSARAVERGTASLNTSPRWGEVGREAAG
jgi:hypothetical protein